MSRPRLLPQIPCRILSIINDQNTLQVCLFTFGEADALTHRHILDTVILGTYAGVDDLHTRTAAGRSDTATACSLILTTITKYSSNVYASHLPLHMHYCNTHSDKNILHGVRQDR